MTADAKGSEDRDQDAGDKIGTEELGERILTAEGAQVDQSRDRPGDGDRLAVSDRGKIRSSAHSSEWPVCQTLGGRFGQPEI